MEMRLWKSLISSSSRRLRVRASYLGETWQENWEDGERREEEHGKEKVLESRERGLGGTSAGKHQQKTGRAVLNNSAQNNHLNGGRGRKRETRCHGWPQISQSHLRQVAFASHASHLHLIPLPIPFIGL